MDGTSMKNKVKNGEMVKDRVRTSLSDPYPRPRNSIPNLNAEGEPSPDVRVVNGGGSDRRARWLKDKMKFHGFSVREEDSGFQDQEQDKDTTATPPLSCFRRVGNLSQKQKQKQKEIENRDRVEDDLANDEDDDEEQPLPLPPSHLTRRNDLVNAKYKWRRRGASHSHNQTPSPLPPIRSSEHDESDVTTCTISEEPFQQESRASFGGLARQNGVRYSLRTRRSPSQSPPCSISSESEVSQKDSLPKTSPILSSPSGSGCACNLITCNRKIGDCDNSHNPSSNKLKANSSDQDQTTGQRKQSVFFSSYGVWSEESVMKSFRDLSPDISSLLEAAWCGNVGAMEDLLRSTDCDVECRDAKGRTPLHLASAGGHAGAVDLLLRKGASVDPCDSFEKATPLMCAAASGSLASMLLLLAAGANVNAGYESGKTPLHWAVQAGSVECAKKLLEKGAKQNPPLVYSENPLHIAASLGDVACLQLLLDFGADVSLCRGTPRSTVLHISAEEGNSPCIRALIKAGASLDARDARGHTPLHVAATVDAECTSILLAAGADPNALDKDGRTPLHSAISRGSRAAECVRLLVESQAEINCQDNFGYTPLHLAAVNESSACTSILLHNGADVTMKTKAGTTALSLLVRRIPDVMRFLVDRLDSAVTIHDHDPGDPDCEVRLDFRAVVPNTDKRLTKGGKKYPEREYYHKPRKETEFLTCVLAAGNKKILNHPLSEAFLTLKWQRVRKFFWASLLFQVALVILFTIFVVDVYLMTYPRTRDTESQAEASHPHPQTIPTTLEAPTEEPLLRIPSENFNGTGPGPGPSLENDFNQTAGTNPNNITTLKPRTYRIKRNSNYSPFSFETSWKPKKKSTPATPTKGPGAATTKPVNFVGYRIGLSTPSTDVNLEVTANESGNATEDETGDAEDSLIHTASLDPWLTVIWCMLIAFTALMAIKETFQFMQAPRSYVISIENWGQWFLIASVLCSAWPASMPILYIYHWQYPATAFGMLLAWGLMLLQVGRFPALGLYVQMLGKVAANFSIVILAYACLLIAFALAFSVIFPGEPTYSSIPKAILKVLTMMVGEVDYEELFYDDKKPLHYSMMSHFLHGAFVIIVTIVLMNLLVGLAVNDIQGLQKGAKLNRLSRQTALISRLESFIFSKRLQAILPNSVGLILQRSALLVPSSYNWSYYFRPNDPRDKRLSKELKQSALRLAAARHSSKHNAKSHKHDYDHATFNNNNIVPHISSTDASLKKMDQRLDKLQNQIDLILNALTAQMELSNKSNVSATQTPQARP